MQVSLFGLHGSFDEIAAQVLAAEQAGFDACLFGEHHGAPMHQHPQLLVLLAGLAARTSRIRLGTSIVLSALYDPVHLAEMAAMVDRNSGGRLILGLGLGYQPQDFQHFAVPFGQRVSRFEEGIEVLRRAWTEPRFSHHGRRYRYQDVAVFPKPLQQPHPPLWIAAWSVPGARRAARCGDAYVTDPIQSLAALSAFEGAYRSAAAEHGRTPAVVLMREILCAPTRDEAIRRYGDGLMSTYRYYWRNDAFVLDWDAEIAGAADFEALTLDQLAADRVILGSPDECVADLARWCEALGASHVQLVVPPGSHESSLDDRLETIRMLGAQVAEPLRRRSGR